MSNASVFTGQQYSDDLQTAVDCVGGSCAETMVTEAATATMSIFSMVFDCPLVSLESVWYGHK